MNEHRGIWRGKCIDNGDNEKWVEGVYNCVDNSITTFETLSTGAIVETGIFYVDPSTLGRCTGLTDKNGKLIFEGDIVTYGDTDNRYYGNYAVIFEQRGGCAYFGIKINNNETWKFCLEVHPKITEVIGNIHDNPKLIESEVSHNETQT